MQILCSQSLPEVWNPVTSPNAGFPSSRCFARPLLQPVLEMLQCLFVSLSVAACCGLPSVNKKACSIWLTDVLEHPISLGMLSQYVLAHYPFVLGLINFAAFARIWVGNIALYTSELIQLLLLKSLSSALNTSDPADWRPNVLISTKLDRCGMPWIRSLSFPSPHCSLSIILYKLIAVSAL